MDVTFSNSSLKRLEKDLKFTNNLNRDLVKAFRKRMQIIRSASDERDLYAFKSLHFEKLGGDRAGQRSVRLNDQWRLIFHIENSDAHKVIVIDSIVDYH